MSKFIEVQSNPNKRKRFQRVDLNELEDSLRSAIGLRKLRKLTKATEIKKKSDIKTEPTPTIRNKNKSLSSIALTEDIKSSELIIDRSLCSFLKYLAPFVSEKVAIRLKSQKTNNDDVIQSIHSDIALVDQPLSVNAIMRDYQIYGISWLINRYDLRINCILADEMGLGKTLQTIAFLAHLKDVKKEGGPHLVVVPLSVLFNWMVECKKFCPSLRIIRLHTNNLKEGKRMNAILSNTDNYDVCVTTYEMVKCATMRVFLSRMHWRCLVLDEGHRIKSTETLINYCCQGLKARFKLILTGTPIQNNLQETYSLLHFLCPTIFNDEEKFSSIYSLAHNAIDIQRSSLSKAHYMLRPFILRRLKKEVEQTLPPKLETMIRCPMSEMQRFFIKSLLLKDSDHLIEIDDANKSTKFKANFSNLNVKKLFFLLAQLRKAANHPFLFPNAEVVDPTTDMPTDDIIQASGKMIILDKLLIKLKARGHRVVLFSQFTKCLDIIGDYLEWKGYNHSRFDGSTSRVMRSVLINDFNRPNSDVFIFCLSTRAGGEGVNLFTADTVILFDSDWNPQVDIQAMARVHRIGQTKPVHIYRLVTAGSIEERIVQRAQKKLFLDTMVNRGSTANALEIDRQLALKNKNMPQEDNEEHIDTGSLLSTLTFGWNACFNSSKENDITDEELDLILDRTRGSSSSSSNSGEGEGRSFSVLSGKLEEHTENTVAEFQEMAPLPFSRSFEGEILKAKKQSSLGDISKEWALNTKRKSVSRFVESHVVGVGKVSVLKINDYNLLDGEPSVFDREGKDYHREDYKDTKKFVQVAGKTFDHQDQCQLCWNYGDLICCERCPTAYHVSCAGLDAAPRLGWTCPHHSSCFSCTRSASAATFLFRCSVCPKAYCEDCLPPDYEFIGHCERFLELGYRLPQSACYVNCSRACFNFDNGLPTHPEDELLLDQEEEEKEEMDGIVDEDDNEEEEESDSSIQRKYNRIKTVPPPPLPAATKSKKITTKTKKPKTMKKKTILSEVSTKTVSKSSTSTSSKSSTSLSSHTKMKKKKLRGSTTTHSNNNNDSNNNNNNNNSSNSSNNKMKKLKEMKLEKKKEISQVAVEAKLSATSDMSMSSGITDSSQWTDSTTTTAAATTTRFTTISNSIGGYDLT